MFNDLACEASLDGYFTRLNGSWEQCLGFSPEELMARPFAELIHPEDIEPTFEVASSLREGSFEVVNFENRYATKDGSWRWLLWSARSDGQRIYAVAKDITERKQREDEQSAQLARLEAIARTDELTGLPNRRALDEELRRELARSKRMGYQLSVAMLDIDHFKIYNDQHGHPAGDSLLRYASRAWRLAIRETDFIARYGGEEFVVLLPACPPGNAPEIIGRLRAATPGGQTVSGGIAVWDGSESAESLLARADQALYAAKREGRDCVVAAVEG